MSSANSPFVPAPESVHDVWLRQRAELERDLFDGCATEVQAVPAASATQPVADVVSVRSQEPVLKIHKPFEVKQPPPTDKIAINPAEHRPKLTPSDEFEAPQRPPHEQRVVETLSQHREAFLQDLARQRAAFEHELSAREATWIAQRDQEWTALRQAKEVQEVAQQRLQDELAAQRVREREELLQWRRQAEAELAEARRVFEQERLQQQQEFARQRETEMTQLRRERDEFETRVRQVHSELAYARQRQEEELRHVRDVQSDQMRAEREELDNLRETWLEKFRREQLVLENGLRFFGEHLSRVSEELRVAQRGLQAVSESATEANPTAMRADSSQTTAGPQPIMPAVLSLDEVRQRLKELKQPQRTVACM